MRVLFHGAVTKDCQRAGRLLSHKPKFIASDRRRLEVRSGVMRYFDTRDQAITIDHIVASSALPPAFPAVRIDGELYWDGGILSNSPTEVIFEDNPRHTSLIFSVHLWNQSGTEPETIWELHRQKDIQYSSRIAGQIAHLKQTHRLRLVITELRGCCPRTSVRAKQQRTRGLRLRHAHARRAPAGAATRQREPHQGPRFQSVRHPHAPGSGILRHHAGARSAAWLGEFDPLEGVILHDRRRKRRQ